MIRAMGPRVPLPGPWGNHPIQLKNHAETFFCGYCLCGHDWTDHHDDKGACEFWGSNETAGLDETETKPHCFRYVDRENPNSEWIKEWHTRWGPDGSPRNQPPS